MTKAATLYEKKMKSKHRAETTIPVFMKLDKEIYERYKYVVEVLNGEYVSRRTEYLMVDYLEGILDEQDKRVRKAENKAIAAKNNR